MQPLLGVRHHESTNGARTRGGQAKAERMIKLLNDALAGEMINILCYRSRYVMTAGICSRHRQAQFLEYVAEKRADVDQLAERIVQLGGRPDVSPERLISRTYAEYVEVDSVGRTLAVDLFAERIAIERYREMIVSLGAEDLTTQQILEMMLAAKDARAESLVSLVRDCTSEREMYGTASPSAVCAQRWVQKEDL
ncbi:MAG: ferritin-like domain-containing protein [Nitrospira sp.]|nr:ferritin-like domain-containing protein [Nitrospira sp.]